MTYTEYTKAEQDLSEARRKVSIEITGDSRTGGHSYSDWTTYYRMTDNATGNYFDYDDGGPNRTIHTDENAQKIEGYVTLGLVDGFSQREYIDTGEVIDYVRGHLYDNQITKDHIMQYLAQKDDLSSLTKDYFDEGITKNQFVHDLKKDIIDILSMDYVYSVDDQLKEKLIIYGNYYGEESGRLGINSLGLDKETMDLYKEGTVNFEEEPAAGFNDVNLFISSDKSHRHLSDVYKFTITPSDTSLQPLNFYYQKCEYSYWNNNQNDRTWLNIVNEQSFNAIKDKRYELINYKDMASLTDLYKAEDKRREAIKSAIEKRENFSHDMYKGYAERYKDNPSLVKALSENNIYDCLTMMARNKVSYKVMDSFVEELDNMNDRLKTNIPSLITLYESYSNAGQENAYKKFAPQTAKTAMFFAHDGDLIFTDIIANYVSAEHERLTGHTVEETIDQFRNERDADHIAVSESISPDKFAELAKNKDKDIRFAVAKNENTPTEVLTDMAKDKNEWEWVRDAIAFNKNTPPDIAANLLTGLAKSENDNIRDDVARSENTPKNVLTDLVKDENECERVRLHVAQNKNTPPKIAADLLTELAKSEDDYVRYQVAENEKTPPDVLTNFAKNKNEHYQVRITVACNEHTPPNIVADLLTELAKSEDDYVRYQVAQNEKTPPDALTHLAGAENERVRLYVAQNKSTPPKIVTDLLTELAGSEDKDIRWHVAENENTPQNALIDLAKDKVANVRYHVARNEKTPPDALTELAKDKSERMRLAVTQNKNTPPKIAADLLTDLAKSQDDNIRSDVARSENIPPDVLTDLAGDKDEYVRLCIAQNKNTSPDMATNLLTNLAESKDENIRWYVALGENTPSKILTELAKNDYDFISQAAVNNKNYQEPSQHVSLNDALDECKREVEEENKNLDMGVQTLGNGEHGDL